LFVEGAQDNRCAVLGTGPCDGMTDTLGSACHEYDPVGE
jgi:hypothetical protein